MLVSKDYKNADDVKFHTSNSSKPKYEDGGKSWTDFICPKLLGWKNQEENKDCD